MVQLSHSYMTTGKTISLIIHNFIGKMISLLFNMLSRFVIAFLPRIKCLLISWLQDQPWDFFGRTDAKAETPVLSPPPAKS